jgi:serine/threonine protein kinase
MTRTGKAVVMKGLHTEHMTDVNSKDSAKREQAKLFWRAFKNEVDILEACGGHPNVVKIVGRAPDYSHFMMEKADLDLNKCLKMNSARLTLGQCSQWFKELLTGVAALHVLGVRERLKCDSLCQLSARGLGFSDSVCLLYFAAVDWGSHGLCDAGDAHGLKARKPAYRI